MEGVLESVASFCGYALRLIGRRENANVNHGGVAAERVDLLVLKETQDVAPAGGGQIADLVEEDGAALSLSNPASLVLYGACERALDMTKEFRVYPFLLQSGAVDGDEWPLLPG